jgi:nucleotide-binding universal stress UspA family protein
MTEQHPTTSASPIVVGIDGSATSAAALKRAARIADALDVDLIAVSAWQRPAFYGGYVMPDYSPEDDWRQMLQDTIVSVFGHTPPARLRSELREGSPAQVLLDASKGAQMLVVGSRGHGGFAGLLLGSVSSAVAEHAECPVLVYHGPGIQVTQHNEQSDLSTPANHDLATNAERA